MLDKAKDFSGKIKLHEKGFGFVKCFFGDIFINPTLIQNHNVKNSDTISGKAILSRKKANSWKAISIQTAK